MTDPNIEEVLERHAEERANWEAERERLRRDRERTAWLLVEAEQRIAALLVEVQQRGTTLVEGTDTPAHASNADLELEIATLRRTVDALRSSTSWRFTRPLRAITGVFRRQKA